MKKLQSCIAYNALFESHLWYGIVAWGGIRAGNLQRICWLKKRAPCSMTILINLEYMKAAEKHFMCWTSWQLYIARYSTFGKFYVVCSQRRYTKKLRLRCTLPFCHTPDTHPDTTCPSTTALFCAGLRRSLHTSGRRSSTYYLKKEGKQLETALNNWMITHPFYSMEELINHQWRNTSIDLTSYEWALTIHS